MRMRKWFGSHARKSDQDGWVAHGKLQTLPSPATQLGVRTQQREGTPLQKLRKLVSEGDIIPATLGADAKLRCKMG